MGRQLFIGLAVEGSTDMRFLKSVVFRTFKDVLQNHCEFDVDVDIFEVNTEKRGKSFSEFVRDASKEALQKYGILILAVHSDSDKETLQERLNDKFFPAQELLDKEEDTECCKVLTPVIPIRMMEAWMLADVNMLKEEIGTQMSDTKLGFYRDPETIADPKDLIIHAIDIAQTELPKKRRTLVIGDLYEIMGDKISLQSLSNLSSYRKFVEFVKDSLRKINYLY